MEFKLDKDQIEKLEKWKKKYHKKCNKVEKGAIGGQYEYSFLPTGVGSFISVKCVICNKEIDLTGDL